MGRGRLCARRTPGAVSLVPVRGLANLGHEPCSEAIAHNLPSTGKNWESLHSLVEYDYLRFQFSESECVFLMRYLLKIARWSSV